MKKLLILLVLCFSLPINAASAKMRPNQQDLNSFLEQIELCHTTFRKAQKTVETTDDSTKNFNQTQMCYEKIAKDMSEKYYTDKEKISKKLSQLTSNGLNVYKHSLTQIKMCQEKECMPHTTIWKHYRVEENIYIFMKNIQFYFQSMVL